MEPGQIIPRLLVVDDKKEVRTLLVQLLEMTGFEVQQAVNGLEAVEIAEYWQPNFIWMDIRMPVMDGWEATKRIRSTEAGQSIVIVALTASVMEEERQTILATGCDDFVRKPYQDYEIFDCMANHLGLRYIYESETALEMPKESR